MVHVKPYHFFKHTGDINAPPGFSKVEKDDEGGVDFRDPPRIPKKDPKPAAEADESSSEDEQEEKKEPRRDSIDMPQFDSNSRDHMEPNSNEEGNSETKLEDKESVPEDGSKSDLKDSVAAPDEKQIGDDLEISDSDSSSGKKSREISDTEDAPEKKAEKKKRDVEDSDDYLLYLEDILRTVHKAYYDLHDQSATSPSTAPLQPDLKMVIPYVRRKILQGVTVVLSGVVPTQVPLQRSKPYLLARAMGATVRTEVDAGTTHLVAARLGTIKVNDARRFPGVAIVTPDWLWECAVRWERVEERLFTLTKHSAVTRRPPAHCSSPEIAFAERCADIDLNLDGGVLGRQPSVAEADPFMSFSTEDLAGMDKEVEDILSGSGESDSEGEEAEAGDGQGGEESSSDADSLTGGSRGHKRPREEEEEDRGKAGRWEEEGEEAASEESGGEDDWGEMGAELERELGN
jgi:RNA polymerase II subunit A-like phosphatase